MAVIKRNVVESYKCNVEQKKQAIKEHLKRILQQNSSKTKMKQYVVRNINISGKTKYNEKEGSEKH